nr:hypothetical protein [Tanacetum cinerariifolium]
MWKVIERLKHGESINVQDLETNLYWEFRKFTSQDGESLESYYLRFYKMMNELIRNQCDVTNHQENVQFLLQLQPEWQRFVTLVKQSQELKTVSYHKLYDILKQHQNEVNEIRAERIARTATPLALVAQQQPELEAHYMYMAKLQEVTPDAAKNSGPIFDKELLEKVSNNDNYNVFAIKSDHPEQSKSVNDTYLIEQDEHNVIIDSLDMSYDCEHINQNDVDNDLASESELLASLVEKLKCEIANSKNHNKFLETSNKVLVEKLKSEIEDFKTKNKSLESTNNRFKEANNKLSETNKLLYNDFKRSQAKLDRRNNMEYASKVEIDCARARGDLISYKMESQKSFNKYTQMINDLNQTISEIKKKLSAYQETISILSQAKEDQIKLYKTREDKELDKVISLENKVKLLDNIVYKTSQSVQTMNMLNSKCKTSFAKPEFLKKAQRANPRLYDIGCYNDDLALMLAPESDEKMVADLRYFNSLALEVDSLRSQLETQKTQFLNEIDRLSREHYYADHMNAILGVYTKLDEVTNLQCDYLELLEKCKCLEKDLSKSRMMSKSFEALQKHAVKLELDLQQCKEKIKTDKSFKDKGIAISELKKLIDKLKGKSVDTRKDFSKSKSVTQNNVSNDFSKSVTAQILPPNKKSILKNTNVLVPGMYKLHTEPTQTRTSQLPNDSSLNAKTLNVNFVCATCEKCVLNAKHDMCVLKSRNGVNSKTKMPIVVSVSTREPKRTVTQTVAKPLRKIVASESTNQKPRNTFRKLYERVSKACSWWYPKFTPPRYK